MERGILFGATLVPQNAHYSLTEEVINIANSHEVTKYYRGTATTHSNASLVRIAVFVPEYTHINIHFYVSVCSKQVLLHYSPICLWLEHHFSSDLRMLSKSSLQYIWKQSVPRTTLRVEIEVTRNVCFTVTQTLW